MNMLYTINASLFVTVVSANAASSSKQKVGLTEKNMRTIKIRFPPLKLHTVLNHSMISLGY